MIPYVREGGQTDERTDRQTDRRRDKWLNRRTLLCVFHRAGIRRRVNSCHTADKTRGLDTFVGSLARFDAISEKDTLSTMNNSQIQRKLAVMFAEQYDWHVNLVWLLMVP